MSATLHQLTVQEIEAIRSGQMGVSYITGTGTNTGNWMKLQVITAATFSVFTATDFAGTFTAVSIPVGTIIEAKITVFTLSAGSVLAYKSPTLS